MLIGKVYIRWILWSLVIHSLLLIMASSNLCVVCKKVVRPRQEGLICDLCVTVCNIVRNIVCNFI